MLLSPGVEGIIEYMPQDNISPVPSITNANQGVAPLDAAQIHPNILNQTLGQLLQNNQQAQGTVMQAMQISPQQLQQLLQMTGNNQLMNTTIGDLFKNGIMQQAGGQAFQVSPQQFQQIVSNLNPQNFQGQNSGQLTQQNQTIGPQDKVPYTIPPARSKPSVLQRLKNLFR